MYWIVVVIILAVAVWLGWEIKNAPLMEECSFCGEVCSPHKMKYLKKEKFFFSAACPRCAEEAEKEGWEELA